MRNEAEGGGGAEESEEGEGRRFDRHVNIVFPRKRAHLRPASLIFDNESKTAAPLSKYQSIEASCRETTTTIAPSYKSISSWIQYSEFPIMAEVRRAEE